MLPATASVCARATMTITIRCAATSISMAAFVVEPVQQNSLMTFISFPFVLAAPSKLQESLTVVKRSWKSHGAVPEPLQVFTRAGACTSERHCTAMLAAGYQEGRRR